MAISAAQVKALRERTGAGMMECKKALVEVDGDLEAAVEALRKSGQAKADKKASRVAAEGRVIIVQEGARAAIVEVNCETDFVANDDNFTGFANAAAQTVLQRNPSTVAELMQMSADGATLESRRTDLVAKIGENIAVRRFQLREAKGRFGSYVHGGRIGVLVDVEGGDDVLARDLAMHIAASNPSYVAEDDVPADYLAKEEDILLEQARLEGKPEEIVQKMVAGRLKKALAEITLLGQPFVKDPDLSVSRLLEQHGARVAGFVRFEVGEGIEKQEQDFAAEVMAQVKQGQ